MAVHPCPRCKRMVPVGVPYCTDCRPLAEAQAEEARRRKLEYKQRQYNRAYNAKRPADISAFYRSKEWRNTSRAYLQRIGYQCEAKQTGCQRLACEVHHIKPIRTPDGWEHRLDADNLMGVCTACHNRLEPRSGKPTPGVIDLHKIKR